MLKRLILGLTVLIVMGCGDGEDRTIAQTTMSAPDTRVNVRLELGETRSLALLLDTNTSYTVDAASHIEAEDKRCTTHELYYRNNSFPEVTLQGVYNSGESDAPCDEQITVTARDASGEARQGLINVTVFRSNTPSDIDIIGGGVDENESNNSDDNGTDGNDDNGTDPGTNPGNPPIISPETDPDACLDTSNAWRTVDDSWGTPEGQFSDNLHFWIRSEIPVEPSGVRLYFPNVSATTDGNYLSVGQYSYQMNDYTLTFSLQMLRRLVGTNEATKFYVRSRGNCFRGNLPTSEFMPPDKTLTPVFAGGGI